jgi:photosystem II stability/assembly factor-like uncharacterized protein/tetratricopeptide (TPR) repeat protein
MAEMLNPYIAGAPVTEPSMFFGREDVFDWIERSLSGRFADHILVIHGQRRVGKTSVLKQLAKRLPERYIPVFFDLQGRTHTTLDRFLWWLAREIVRVLKQERGIEVPSPERGDFAEDPEYFEAQFLVSVRAMLPRHILLLAFDEFDSLEESEIKEELARPLIDYLRRLMGQERLNFIFSIGSSGRKLENMQASYTEFFKTALYKKISFLSEGETRNLVVRPVEGVLEYERAAVDRIYNITSGHPYFTQLICHELFANSQRSGQRKVTRSDVEVVLEDVVERGTVNLKFMWDEASDIEKWGLAALAQLEKTDNRGVADFLHKQHVRFSEPELTSGLLHLREKDVLTPENRFVNYLLKLWLQKNRPMEQVREELTEVNPIANRYIEIGLEFKDAGVFDKAIESFQEALAVDADNVRARVSLAGVYLQRKDYASAVAGYQKALAVDEEDFAARAGLCEAHLALGEVALDRGRTKEAIRSFQQVLAINAEHTEARQRMADIHRKRAEQAVAERKVDEAIAAFREARQYTPEDDSLEFQYQEILKKQRAVILAGLMAKVERARAGMRWEEAIALLQEALSAYPGDERLKRELEEGQKAQRKGRLDALLAKAEQASKAGQWEEAIRADEEYLAIAPDDQQAQERLAQAKVRHRQAQLQACKERAQSYAAAERWEDALASWKGYLDLEPEDRSQAMEEMKQAELKRERWQSYQEARDAFAKKDYDRAVKLLRGIVFEDENYKDASRLMAEAIELRRTVRPFWKTKWLWGAIGVLAIAAVGFALDRLGIFSPPSQSAATGTASGWIAFAPTSIQTLTPSLAPTSAPTATPTPVPVFWSRISSGREFSRDDITVMAADPSDPGVIYVGTENAGIFKSIDGAISWQPMHNGLGRAWIHSIVVDPEDPRTVYAGVSTGGVYKTINGGASWFAVNEGLDFGWEGAASLALDPRDHQHLLFTAANALFESIDGGETWATINSDYPSGCFVSIRFDPPGRTIFAVSVSMHADCKTEIFKSEDDGRSWEATGPEGLDIDTHQHQLLAIDQQSGEVLLVSTLQGIYKSEDGGDTWQSISNSVCRSIAIAPSDANTAYCGRENKVLKTTDGGASWTTYDTSFDAKGGWAAILPLPDDPQVILVGSQDILLSTDGGQTWEERSSGLGAGRIEPTFDPSDSSVLYLEDRRPGKLYRSTDGGRSWSSLDVPGGDLALDSAGELLYRLSDEDLVRSSDRGLSWGMVPCPMDGEVRAIAAHPRQSQWVYVTYNRGYPPYVFLSKDAGNSWIGAQGMESISDGRLYFDHEDADVVYVFGDMDAFRSEDGGETWERCGSAADWYSRSNSRLVVDPRDSSHLILATRGEGVSVSQDACQSWQFSNKGLGSLFLNTIVYDPNNPDTLYAGGDSGAYISFNGGVSWSEINDGLLGATIVYSIAVDPVDPSNVYAATPYGIFKLESR